jgi:predicted  nucleic acid-binding Zn ribbon protein
MADSNLQALQSYPETPEDEICQCNPCPPIKLMHALSNNPLHCIKCNLEINTQKFALETKIIDYVVRWRNLYDAIYTLWLDSREYEEWAQNELSDIHSPVNQTGLKVQQELNKARKTYYWHFQNQSADNFKPAVHCPNCKKSFRTYSDGIFAQFICEECSIITVGE